MRYAGRHRAPKPTTPALPPQTVYVESLVRHLSDDRTIEDAGALAMIDADDALTRERCVWCEMAEYLEQQDRYWRTHERDVATS